MLLVVVCSVSALAQALPKQEPGKQQANTDTRGTKDRPVVIEIGPSAPLKIEADHNTDAANEKAWNEWRIAWGTVAIAGFTLVLAVATICLAVFTYRLWGATGKLVAGAQDTARKELRAYMGVATNHILRERGASPTTDCWELVIKNFGKTMAMDTQISISTTVGGGENVTNFPWDEKTTKTVVMPGETLGFHYDIAMPRPDSTTNRGYLWGKIKYEDVFGKDHFTTFRFMSDQAAYVSGGAPG